MVADMRTIEIRDRGGYGPQGRDARGRRRMTLRHRSELVKLHCDRLDAMPFTGDDLSYQIYSRRKLRGGRQQRRSA